jgi:BirA family biotin operon repressor/biotin-[acetyl-CoA-carboxylase] ligase
MESQQKYQRMLAAGEYKQIVSSYHERLYRREGYHPYRDAQGPFEARLERVADDGRLLLIDKDGRHREYRFKEVQFII